MKHFLIFTLAAVMLAGCGTARTASRDRAFLDCLEYGYQSEYYQQDRLMRVDPEGDAHLIRKLDTIPIKLFSYLFKEPLPQSDNEPPHPDFKIGRTVPFDNDQLLNQCRDIMRRHYPAIHPTIGEEHEWSPEAKRYMVYGYWHRLWRRITGQQRDFPCPLLMRSKLFLCLACGWTSRYCVTGQEEALTERILSYPDRSVRIPDMFAESYVLNQGDVYLTFLTCENVLAGMPHRYGRENDPLQQKLTYIRHDSMEAGDNYGAWYHFFGIALYGMVRTDIVGLAVADIENMGSFFYEGPDRQEGLINHHGALFGYRFKQMMEEGTWWIPVL